MGESRQTRQLSYVMGSASFQATSLVMSLSQYKEFCDEFLGPFKSDIKKKGGYFFLFFTNEQYLFFDQI